MARNPESIRDKIISQCWTIRYRWMLDVNSEWTGLTINYLFELLKQLDPEADRAVVDAALSKLDFPADVSKKYPVPVKRRSR